jgi:hypothetical protein
VQRRQIKLLITYNDTHHNVQSTDNATMFFTGMAYYKQCGVTRIAVMTTVVCEPYNIIILLYKLYLNLVRTGGQCDKLVHGTLALSDRTAVNI